jgi:peptide/nickel transport system substrate-binding protein
MFQRRRKIGVAGVAAVAATALLAAGCGSSSSNSNTGTSSGSVKGAVATLSNLNGAGANCILPFEGTQCYSVENYDDFMNLMTLPLYQFGGNSSTSIGVNYPLSPASAPVYTDGGKTVTIQMKGWKWSNGEAVDAQDVVFFLNMFEAEKANYAGYTPGLLPDNLTSYSATGKNTLVLHLKQAYSSIWFTYNQLAVLYPMPLAWDVTKAGAAAGSGGCAADSAADGWAKCKAVFTYLNAQNKDTATYATNPLWQVVDGPWKLSAFNIDGNYTFLPNKDYSGSPKPSIAQLVFKNYTSDTAIFTALKTGEVSLSAPQSFPPTELGKAVGKTFLPASNPLQSAGYTLKPQYEFGIGFAYINFNNPTYGPAFKQLYFRQALTMLDNQPGMDSAVGRGYTYPTSAGVPPEPASQWTTPLMAENGGQGPYPYNPTKAKALLAAHGWKVVGGVLTCQSAGTGAADCGAGVKKGTQAKFQILYTSGNSVTAGDADILKSGFAQAGIQLTTTAETFNTLLTDTVPCKPTQASCKWTFLFLGGWLFNGPGYEPTGEALYQTGVPSNSGSYSDPKMDSLINATHTSNSLSAFDAFANYNAQQVPALWTPWNTVTTAVSNDMHNVQLNPLLTLYPQFWSCSSTTC